MFPIAGLLELGGKLIDKLIPDPAEKAKAKLQLAQLQQEGSLQDLQTRMSAILAEEKSNDPWTSRARPSFLYVIYLMILASLPMGVLYALQPTLAHNISTGMQQWLAAIPQPLWTLFGAGYLGYTGARSFDKNNIIKSKNPGS